MLRTPTVGPQGVFFCIGNGIRNTNLGKVSSNIKSNRNSKNSSSSKDPNSDCSTRSNFLDLNSTATLNSLRRNA